MCLSPIILNTDKAKYHTEHTTPVPCGKCVQCLSRRKNQWVFRLQQELKVAKSAAFITLTYEDEHLPITANGLQTLKIKDFQDYMKRLRKNTKAQNLKFYQAGEYGELTERPHYHQILFNLEQQYLEEEYIQNTWQKGHVSIGQVTAASIAYTAKYIMKGTYKPKNENDDRSPVKASMSNGIGKNFLTPQMEEYIQNAEKPYITMEQGQKVAMPKYYSERIFTKNQAKAIRKNNYEEPQYDNEKHKHEHIKKQINLGERKLQEQEQKTTL